MSLLFSSFHPGCANVFHIGSGIALTFPCSPLGESLNDIAGFGRGEIVDEWDVSVIKVYKLIHYAGQ